MRCVLGCSVAQVFQQPAFAQTFELWKEDGILHLTVAANARVDVGHMKEFIRLVAALDRSGKAPVVMGHSANVVVSPMARGLLRRVCGANGHPVALVVLDRTSQAQAELFLHVERPAFPFKVFHDPALALRWARSRSPVTGQVDR